MHSFNHPYKDRKDRYSFGTFGMKQMMELECIKKDKELLTKYQNMKNM